MSREQASGGAARPRAQVWQQKIAKRWLLDQQPPENDWLCCLEARRVAEFSDDRVGARPLRTSNACVCDC